MQPELDLTQSQKDALEKANTILAEHFDSHLLVITTLLEEYPHREYAHSAAWSGGTMTALGMAEYAKAKLQKSFVSPDEEDEKGVL